MVGEARNRTVETSQEGAPYANDMKLMDMEAKFFAACCKLIVAIEELYLWKVCPDISWE